MTAPISTIAAIGTYRDTTNADGSRSNDTIPSPGRPLAFDAVERSVSSTTLLNQT